MSEVEREFGLTVAYQRAIQFAQRQGWRAHIAPVGAGAWQCHLVDARGTVVPGGMGAGKGDAAQAHVGAAFEAIEHHLSQNPTL